MTTETLKTAFNIVVRYGLCGDCRFSLGDKNCVNHDCYSYVKQIEEACEKQIPKKAATIEVDNEFRRPDNLKYHVCPCCGIDTPNPRNLWQEWCPDCGQHIDWSEEE